jgi:hypothetical protein
MVEINASGADQPQPAIVQPVRMGCMRSRFGKQSKSNI